MISGINGAAQTSDQQTTSSATKTAAGAGVDKNTFLKLLVAQIRNQNPLNPADGMQFVAELAQFTQLEETMQMQSDISAIREHWDAAAATETGEGENAARAADETPSVV